MFRIFLSVALLASLPSFLFAQERNPATQLDAHLIAIPAHRYRPIPGPPPGEGWVWVPPVYRTVYTRVWQAPVYQTITENVWVPDRYEWQTVCILEDGQYVERQVWVLVPGHYETQTRRVMVSAGGWNLVPRQEMVSPGHWEWRGRPAPMPPIPQPLPQPHVSNPRPPGLEPFSPLWEWPADSK